MYGSMPAHVISVTGVTLSSLTTPVQCWTPTSNGTLSIATGLTSTSVKGSVSIDEAYQMYFYTANEYFTNLNHFMLQIFLYQ